MRTRAVRQYPLVLCLLLAALLLPTSAGAEISADSATFEQYAWELIGVTNDSLLPAGQIEQAREMALLLQCVPLSAEAHAYTHYLLALAASYEDGYVAALAHYRAMQACEGSLLTLIGGMDGEVTTLMLAGDYEGATDAAEALIATVEPSDLPQAEEFRAGAACQVGEMRYREERYAEALAQFRALLADYPQTSWVSAAQAKVDELSTALSGGAQ